MRWLICQRVAAADDRAELDASIDTVLLLGRAARYSSVGRTPGGPWSIGLPLRRPAQPTLREIQRVVDLLRYERNAARVVAIIAQPPSLADLCVECLAVADGLRGSWSHPLTGWYGRALRRDGEGHLRWPRMCSDSMLRSALVHTTSTNALPAIVEAGALKSAALMKNADEAGSESIGATLLNEPPDYAEYVIFSLPTDVAGEKVVNSRRLGHLWGECGDDDYVPGVRMYFSRQRLESHPGVTFDGVHLLKIRGQVALAGHLAAVATANSGYAAVCQPLGVPVLRPIGRTPEQYVADSNRLFARGMAAPNGLMRGARARPRGGRDEQAY